VNGLGQFLSNTLRRIIPDAFVFALLLTLGIGALATLVTDASPKAVVDAWYKGFWILLEFGMQMVLMLTTGFAIALSPTVARLIERIALVAREPGMVYVIVAVVGGLFGLVSRGWAVLSAVLARELASRVNGVDYAYLAACAYCAGLVWVCGLSSSIPLVLNTAGNFLIETGVLDRTIPITSTLGSTMNIIYAACFFISVPALLYVLRPRTEHTATIDDLREAESVEPMAIEVEAQSLQLDGSALSDRLNNSRLLTGMVAAAGFWFVIDFFARNGFDLDLNIMIFVFINAGLLLHQTPMR
jgi:short-chain fatty acids transporter